MPIHAVQLATHQLLVSITGSCGVRR